VTSEHIRCIKIPTLLINARDDPIVSRKCIPFAELKQNPNIILAETCKGGHVCWFTGLKPKRVSPRSTC